MTETEKLLREALNELKQCRVFILNEGYDGHEVESLIARIDAHLTSGQDVAEQVRRNQAVPEQVATWAKKVLSGGLYYPDNSKYERPVAEFIAALDLKVTK